MKRNLLLYAVNIVLLILSIIVALTGLIKFPGLLHLLRMDPLALPLKLFTFLHDWGGVAIIVASIAHIFLNWKWLTGITRKYRLSKYLWALFGILFAVVSVLLLLGRTSGDDLTAIIEDVSNPTITIERQENVIEEAQLDGTMPEDQNQVIIDGIGTFKFNPQEISSTRPDVFNAGYFSLFDILSYLGETGQISFEYAYSEAHGTHLIESINGTVNWWYIAYYDGGWPENNTWRMDLFPYKEKTFFRLVQVDPELIDQIYAVYAEEVVRMKSNTDEEIIIPKVIIKGESFSELFEDVRVTPHNLRPDYLLDGTITALDVILSLGDEGLLTYNLNWYESIGSAGIVKNYFIDGINNDQSYNRCGFVYEMGDEQFAGFWGNHIHIPTDIRVIQAVPEYVEFFWICI